MTDATTLGETADPDAAKGAGPEASTIRDSADPVEAGSIDPAPRPPAGHGAPPLRPSARLWADLMRRTFGFDVLACPRCGGRFRLIALIEEAAVIQRILNHLHVPTEIPEPRPGRAPPLLDAGSFTQDTDVAGCNSCS